MLKRWADNRDPASWASRLRARRFSAFRQLIDTLEGDIHIVDVGGTIGFWVNMLAGEPSPWRVTVVNLTQPRVGIPQRMALVRADARALPFADQSASVVFSNSVIEHVGTWNDQQRMASEIARVGQRYFVQTPNRYFPIEPHFLFPWFQFLPESIRIALHQRFNLGWYPRATSREAAIRQVREIRLLTEREVRAAFPDGHISRERLLGLTKSLMAQGGWTHP